MKMSTELQATAVLVSAKRPPVLSE